MLGLPDRVADRLGDYIVCTHTHTRTHVHAPVDEIKQGAPCLFRKID